MRTALVGLVLLASATIQAQAPAYERGELVHVRDVPAPKDFVVVGVPSDRIRADDSAVYVNDSALTGFSAEFLVRAAETFTATWLEDGIYVVPSVITWSLEKSESTRELPSTSVCFPARTSTGRRLDRWCTPRVGRPVECERPVWSKPGLIGVTGAVRNLGVVETTALVLVGIYGVLAFTPLEITNLGVPELVIAFVVALHVFGPRRFPRL